MTAAAEPVAPAPADCSGAALLPGTSSPILGAKPVVVRELELAILCVHCRFERF